MAEGFLGQTAGDGNSADDEVDHGLLTAMVFFEGPIAMGYTGDSNNSIESSINGDFMRMGWDMLDIIIILTLDY